MARAGGQSGAALALRPLQLGEPRRGRDVLRVRVAEGAPDDQGPGGEVHRLCSCLCGWLRAGGPVNRFLHPPEASPPMILLPDVLIVTTSYRKFIQGTVHIEEVSICLESVVGLIEVFRISASPGVPLRARRRSAEGILFYLFSNRSFP